MMAASAVVGGVLLALIEGVGIVMHRSMSEQITQQGWYFYPYFL